ncbi:MAG: DnaD domain protein [Clostridia bacterium]|nr:DnaD domain protein [Clostridia bacterium]
MKLTQNDKSLLFSSTELPDAFFTEYLPESNGDFIKVYIYILFLSKYNTEIKINDLSKTLSLDFPTVQDAIKYWEEKGLITKTIDGYSIANLQEIELSKLYTPKVTSSPEDALKNSQNQYRAKAIEDINKLFFQGVMSPSWYNDIDFWFTKYEFDEQVMIALFNYCHDNRALHRNYIQTVAEGWSQNHIRTFNDLDAYFEKQEKRNSIKKAISKKLNLYRNLTAYDEEYIVKWTENLGYGMDVIEIALKKASSNNNIRFEYIDKLLTDWHNKSLQSPEEVNTYLDSIKDKEKKTKQIEKVAYEYTQSTFDNLDSLYDN